LETAPVRARYSLRSLLILVAVAGVIIGSYVVGTRLRQAERELKVLREETGRLSISDRSQIHVINVAVGNVAGEEPNTWRWRLFIPKGQKYSWNLAAKDIPQLDVPQQAGVKAVSNEPYWERDNEVLVTARLRREDDTQWRLSVESRIGDSKNQMGGGSLKIPAENLAWNTEGASTDGRVAGSSGTKLYEPRRAIILLQRRPVARRADGTYGPSPDPMPGFMIWLNPE
jgi:hypothetical protein